MKKGRKAKLLKRFVRWGGRCFQHAERPVGPWRPIGARALAAARKEGLTMRVVFYEQGVGPADVLDLGGKLHKPRTRRGSWEEVVSVVEVFKRAMLRKLKKNQYKGNRPGWKKDAPGDLVARVNEEAMELDSEIEAFEQDRAAILDEAADVANMAMMVADASGAIRLR